MKRLLLLLIIPFFLMSCEEQYSGGYSLRGYCYDPCNGVPLEGFQVAYSHKDAYFETYTDANGYFELSGSYKFSHKEYNLPGTGSYSIRDKAGIYGVCGSFVINDETTFDNDTVFFYHKVNSVYTIKMDSNTVSTNQDTVFFRFLENCNSLNLPSYTSYHETDSSRLWFSYNKYFVGPFHDHQILDTVETWLYPHTGHLNENFYNLSYMYIASNTKNRGFKPAYFSSNIVFDSINCFNYEPVEIIIE